MEIISQLFANITGLATAVFIAFLTAFFTVQSFNNFHEHPENTTRKFYVQRAFFAVLAFIVAFVVTEFLIGYLAS
jgi:hypothetical protein